MANWLGYNIYCNTKNIHISHISETKKITIYTYQQDEGAGLVAAAMIAIVPGYISRSVAGSYDNEGIAIFCMLLTYYLWIKAVNTGTIMWATMTALAYFYMASFTY